ncbi:MAG: T9SS type A sorting domain-containing protein [Bacteroidales bacterium]|nr:T9SS type A sorting domain-containing protein [Bacteroidales bacterium]
MKTIKLFFVIIISFFMFTNNAKADTIYIDLDTTSHDQILTVCQDDTLNIFHSLYPNPMNWSKFDIGMAFGESPYIIITSNNLKYSNDGINWTTWSGQTNGRWKMTGSWSYSRYFYIYFTDPVTEPWSINSDAICGSSDTLYAENYQDGLYYQWYEIGVGLLSEGYYPNDTALIVDHTADYVVGITGCNGTVFDTISMTLTTTNLPDLGQDHSFCGTSVYADLFLMEEYDSYLWSTGSTDSAITVTSISQSPDTIWVEVENQCIGTQRDTVLLFQEFYPTLDIGPDTMYICPGESVTLSTGFEYDLMSWVYDWSGIELSNDSSITITPSQDTTLFVYVREGLCPSMEDSIRIVLVQTYEDNNLCVVTVDTSGYNKIVWYKEIGEGIADYNIYRLNVTYNLIGTVDIGSPAVFYDSLADPNSSAYRYKITAVDTCGNESDLSTYHSTIHIISTTSTFGGIDLTVTDMYEDESGTFVPNMYYIMCDSLANGNMQVTDSMSTAYNSKHIQNPYPGAVYAMAVALPWNCDGGAKASTTLSFSNRIAPTQGILDYANASLNFYPNPVQDRLYFEKLPKGAVIKIFDVNGKIILEQSPQEMSIDVLKLSPGIYTILMLTDDELGHGVFVKE